MRRLAFRQVGAALVCGASSYNKFIIKNNATVIPNRSIYSTWVDIPCEPQFKKEGWLKRILSQYKYRSFDFWHVPEATVPLNLNLNKVELYLLSCIEDDTNRLLNVSWGYDFDPFWHDRVNSHDLLFQSIYENKYPVYQFIFGNCSHKVAERAYIEEKLNYLKNVLYWAARTQRRFTAITKARYYVQREVWNALQRQRYLCGCVQVIDSFRQKVPEQFREKAMSQLELKLINLRHWVYDCPNGKFTFTRRLA